MLNKQIVMHTLGSMDTKLKNTKKKQNCLDMYMESVKKTHLKH